MNTIGILTSLRSSATRSNILSVVTPPLSARRFAPCITGPSAVGSEKGIPSSIRSAPFSAAARTIFAVVSRSGSPQVMNGMNALPFLKADLILLMDILPSVAGDGSAVLVASARNCYDDYLVLVHSRSELHSVCYSVCGLDSGDDSLCT